MKRKKVLVFGTFDGIHKGHLSFLNQAKEHGDYLTVVVAKDSNVKKLKGHKPLNNEKQRKAKIKKAGFVFQQNDLFEVCKKSLI